MDDKRKKMILNAALNYARSKCDDLNEVFEMDYSSKASDDEEISVDGMTGNYFTEEDFEQVKAELSNLFGISHLN